MPFRSPILRLSQLIADRLALSSSANGAGSFVVDPGDFAGNGGPGLELTPQGMSFVGLVLALATSATKPIGSGTALRLLTRGSSGGAGVSTALTVDPLGASGINGPWSFSDGIPVAGLTFGATSVSFDASGNATIPHRLAAAPTFANAGCAPRSRIVRVTGVDSFNLTLGLADNSGAAVANETRTIRWLALY